MTQFMSKSFSVALGLNEQGRKNYERIFRKRRAAFLDDMKCASCGAPMLSVSADCRAGGHGRPPRTKKKAPR